MLQILFGAVLIFVARTVDVSMGTIRTIFTIRGKWKQAAFIGFFEVIIYVSALGMIVQNLNKPINLIAYGLGFACGIMVGSKIEERLALGYITVQVVLKDDSVELTNLLREEGYGVTTFDAEGLIGPKKVLNIFVLRKNLNQIINVIHDFQRDAFITVMDARSTMGGYIKMTKKK
ncbi:MAG: DUF2179 domain-containing protein [Halanaerobiales bacterium]|nr:DUF2179 domain-containing protein [Halanaerobiales bacterium]